MIIHLLYGFGFACMCYIPRDSVHTDSFKMVTCKRCKRTKIYSTWMAYNKAKRARNGMKQRELFESDKTGGKQ